jgi:RNA polymerase sigma-70 factor (ECF subfamily)
MSTGEALRSAGAANAADDDAALMRGIFQQNAGALERLYDRHSPRVFAFCLRSLSDRGEAEELVLDIFWELWRRPERYDAARSSPWTYLMQVTRSRLVDRLRSMRARASKQPLQAHAQHTLEDRPLPRSQEPIDQLSDVESGDRLRLALAALTPDQRQAVEMAYFDAMSYSEVADALGAPLGTVKSRIRQALAQLRQALDRKER